jgi:ribosomal protein S18 acetylase RimI-like enzyme
VIRPIRPSEADLVGEMTVTAYRGLPGRWTSAHQGYEPLLRDVRGRAERSSVLVAELDGEVVGTVTYVPGPGPDAEGDDPDAAEIRMLAVADHARGRGIGRQLVVACIDRARAEGRRRIALHTRDVMEHALRIYHSLGFRREPDLDFDVGELRLYGYVLELE